MNKLDELSKLLGLTKEEKEKLKVKVNEYSAHSYRGMTTIKDTYIVKTGEIVNLDNKMCNKCCNLHYCKRHIAKQYYIYFDAKTKNCWMSKNKSDWKT